MSLSFNRLRGMQDVLPPEGDFWRKIENIMLSCAEFYGFSFIRTPILEFTELFDRSAGDSSDIVQKEMYTFNDKSGRSVTLRPEFTAGVLRAVINGLSGSTIFPLKLMYFGPCYRYEKPQVGRYREFFQFGLEIFGGSSNLADLEIILLASKILSELGIDGFNLEINAIGCPDCRQVYLNEIRSFFGRNRDSLCETCNNRLSTNPLRIFDCKNDDCKKISENAPHTIDFICKNCKTKFEIFKKFLDVSNISYDVNTRMVRGLDYYNNLVFEFVLDFDGKPLTICGGGRYDGLSKSLGGPDLPATGCAFGIERLIKLLHDKEICQNIQNNGIIYVACIDEESKILAVDIVCKLRSLGVKSDYDLVDRGLKSQMRYANKMGYKYVAVIGQEEINSGVIGVKDMSSSEVFSFKLSNFAEEFEKFLKN